MRAGPLSENSILSLLAPFIVTTWHGKDEADMPTEVRAIYTKSQLARDPNRSNMFAFVLDEAGKVVHEFHGLAAGRRGGSGRSDWTEELRQARAKLNIASGTTLPSQSLKSLPDLTCAPTAPGLPAGVRLFIRRDDSGEASRSAMPVVEVTPLTTAQARALACPRSPRTVDPDLLRAWLVQLYPPAIRTVDQKVPFGPVQGSLKLEPAGTDGESRYALLRGKIKLQKEGASESAFEGVLEIALSYPAHSPDVRSLRGTVEGAYLYRVRGTQAMKLKAALESRPE